MECPNPEDIKVVAQFDEEWFEKPLDLSPTQSEQLILQSAHFKKSDVSATVDRYF
ncbi:hypothetical protein GCM10011339_15260 [Echinicola rosea]|uniref:Uncharacterized protein n=1 Tax=Echinicola rosea TaxID=1807691 RepID=A0ABQ1UVU8_9BACT|nr:hypothetical protein GCM10011339_15260 [Echinicola rosea]